MGIISKKIAVDSRQRDTYNYILYFLLKHFFSAPKYQNFDFVRDAEVTVKNYRFFGDVVDQNLSAQCRLSDTANLTAFIHEPFELILDTRDAREVLRKEDIQVLFYDSKTEKASKSKVIDKRDGTFGIRLMALTSHSHFISIKV